MSYVMLCGRPTLYTVWQKQIDYMFSPSLPFLNFYSHLLFLRLLTPLPPSLSSRSPFCLVSFQPYAVLENSLILIYIVFKYTLICSKMMIMWSTKKNKATQMATKTPRKIYPMQLLVGTRLYCTDNLDVQCILQFSFGGHGSSKNAHITKEDPSPILLVFP